MSYDPTYLQQQCTSGGMHKSNKENSNIFMDDDEPYNLFASAVDNNYLDLNRVQHKLGANSLAMGMLVGDEDGGCESMNMSVNEATDSDREKFDYRALARQTQAAYHARPNSIANCKRLGLSSSSGHQRRQQQG